MRSPAFLAVPAVLLSAAARADPAPADAAPAGGPSFEANLVQPFLGIVDDKLLIPVSRADHATFRGELMAGIYTDFAWGPISRPADQYGKVWILGARPGYREYLAHGFFVDSSIVVGWRHEVHDVHDGGTLDGAYGRLWADAGWELALTPRTSLNLRGGLGLIIFRTDRYGSTEKMWQPAGDLDLRVRF
jgi:hypothetical protein